MNQFKNISYEHSLLLYLLRWYHGRLGRKGAEEFLLKNNEPCSYLVRESDRKPGIYSLSYLSNNKTLSHFRVTAICGDYYIGGRKFQSLLHLIGYYSTYGNLVKNEKLQNPCLLYTSPSPRDKRQSRMPSSA